MKNLLTDDLTKAQKEQTRNWGFEDGRLASKKNLSNKWLNNSHPNSFYREGYLEGYASIDKCEGHECFLGKWEYFIFNTDLYRAPKVNSLDINSIRLGGRLQAPSHLIESTLEFHKEAFSL